jgi:hypothetical protein
MARTRISALPRMNAVMNRVIATPTPIPTTERRVLRVFLPSVLTAYFARRGVLTAASPP